MRHACSARQDSMWCCRKGSDGVWDRRHGQENGRIWRQSEQNPALHTQLYEAVWDSPSLHPVPNEILFCTWSSKLCEIAPSVHFNNAGNRKAAPEPLERIHERTFLCDEGIGRFHDNCFTPRNRTRNPQTEGDGRNSWNHPKRKSSWQVLLNCTRALEGAAWVLTGIWPGGNGVPVTTPWNHSRKALSNKSTIFSP